MKTGSLFKDIWEVARANFFLFDFCEQEFLNVENWDNSYFFNYICRTSNWELSDELTDFYQFLDNLWNSALWSKLIC